jgi:hypothetical protein
MPGVAVKSTSLVILSGVKNKRSAVLAESKDPYLLK